jgi:hypothetical protein
MATAAQIALDKLEQQRGDIDEFVRQRMGYESKAELWQYLYAEQIDAVALAFHQRDRGRVFLNGDQTGNGKAASEPATLSMLSIRDTSPSLSPRNRTSTPRCWLTWETLESLESVLS